MVEKLIKLRTLLANGRLCSCQSTASQTRLIEKVITEKRYNKSRVYFPRPLQCNLSWMVGWWNWKNDFVKNNLIG